MTRIHRLVVLALPVVVFAAVSGAAADAEEQTSPGFDDLGYGLEAAGVGEIDDTQFDEDSAVEILDLPALDVDQDTEGRIRMDLPGLTLVGPLASAAGCTPGYWKNHPQAWPGYLPGSLLGDVFGAGAGDETLLDALSFGGGKGVEGGRKILLRAAVASLLNTAHPDLSFTYSSTDTIIDSVGVAIGSANRDAMLALAALFDAYNNAVCPLGR